MTSEVNLTIDVHDLAPEAVVARLIDHAVDLQASDLFFASQENHVAVSVRHLGLYRPLTLLKAELGKRCISLIKANAGLDFADHRHPLDGRWLRVRPDGARINLRIDTLPTLYGEDVNLRLLVRSEHLLQLENLGLEQRDWHLLLELLAGPSGLILVTGPTGSGKTTTLYAALNRLANGERKINTIEDPIEYALDGIRQSQVSPHLHLDFPDVLRAVLRQAPDVIMIGEIRDPVTAETAVRAANSGHLVLATLHAPVADAAVQSMHSLGVNPHFLGASLRGIIAQRLLRTLCPRCKVKADATPIPGLLNELHLSEGQEQSLFAARGCSFCHGTGYTSRTGVFEVLHVTEPIRKLIYARQPSQFIRTKAIEEGMVEIRRSALLKVLAGESSSQEILRVIPAEYLGMDG